MSFIYFGTTYILCAIYLNIIEIYASKSVYAFFAPEKCYKNQSCMEVLQI